MKDEKKAWTVDLSKVRRAGDPDPGLSPEELAKLEAMAKEHQDIREARLAVPDAWNWLENSLVQLLGTVVGTPDPIVSSILYFTPHSFRTRVDTISKLIEHLVVNGAKDVRLQTDWDSLARKLTKRRTVRNYASHGHIITYAEPDGKNRALLAPVMMQMDSYLGAYKDGRLPGAPLHEVRDAISSAQKLCGEVEAFHLRIKSTLGRR